MVAVELVGYRKVIEGLKRMPKQTRFATAVALTRTAKDVHAKLTREMRSVFDRPTPYTLKSHFWLSARAKNLEVQSSRVGIKDFGGKGPSANKYLAPQIFGEQRDQKRFEYWIGSHRIGSGSNQFLVPGPGAPLDSYGNVRRNIYAQVMSALKVGIDPMQYRTARSAKRGKKKQYFIGEPRGGGAAAVFERRADRIRPLFWFTSRPRYKKRYDFYGVGTKEADRVYDAHFKREYEKALATAFLQ